MKDKSAFKYLAAHKGKLILLIAAVLILMFIWTNSFIRSDESRSESRWFTKNVLNPIFRLFGFQIRDRVTRKLAHVFEYFVLSIIITLFFDGRPLRSLYSGFTAAFIDETIQAITSRGPLITDVWIDMIGVTAGFLIVLLVLLIRRRKKRRKTVMTEESGEISAAETGGEAG